MTVDGLEYTFNGLGEYWLIKSTTLNVQVETVEVNRNLMKMIPYSKSQHAEPFK